MVQNESLFKHLSDLAKIVLPLIPPAIQSSFFPSMVDNYPNLKYKESGFPEILTYPSIIDVSQFFRSYGNSVPKIDLDSFPEFVTAMQVVAQTPEIITYLSWPSSESANSKFRNDIFQARYKGFLLDVIEHYYYLYGEIFQVDKFRQIYLPLENFLYCERIDF